MICFWSQSTYKIFSNFTPVIITLDGLTWPSVEHYYQAQKFTDLNRQSEIRSAPTAAKTKRLARKYAQEVRPDWESMKLSVMEKALRAKYNQEPFKSALLATGNAEIVEDSPKDLFWGSGIIGGPGPGKNQMGHLLMTLRSQLK
jgi:ribA/ribD-fused uncharacterized protein